jgi:hypothetical protein
MLRCLQESGFAVLAMARTAEQKAFRMLPVHAAVGACLGAVLLWGLTLIDGSAFAALSRSNESGANSLAVLSFVFASYFAVGSGLTGFILIATEQQAELLCGCLSWLSVGATLGLSR